MKIWQRLKKIVPSAEIRHLDNIRSNFVVADGKQYLGYAFPSVVGPYGISTNTIAIVEAHQFLFEFLWNAAMPAEVRMGQLERNLPIEKTEILYGQENIIRHFLNDLSNVHERFDSCTDFTGPSLCGFSYLARLSRAVKEGNKVEVYHRNH